MNPEEARLECLKLVLGNQQGAMIREPDAVVRAAGVLADFVLGPPRIESKNVGRPKGRDEK